MASNREAIFAQFFALNSDVVALEATVNEYRERRAKHFAAYPERIESLRKQIATMEAAIEIGEKPATDAEVNASKRLRTLTSKRNGLVRSHSWLASIEIPSFSDLLSQIPEDAEDDSAVETPEDD